MIKILADLFDVAEDFGPVGAVFASQFGIVDVLIVFCNGAGRVDRKNLSLFVFPVVRIILGHEVT